MTLKVDCISELPKLLSCAVLWHERSRSPFELKIPNASCFQFMFGTMKQTGNGTAAALFHDDLYLSLVGNKSGMSPTSFSSDTASSPRGLTHGRVTAPWATDSFLQQALHRVLQLYECSLTWHQRTINEVKTYTVRCKKKNPGYSWWINQVQTAVHWAPLAGNMVHWHTNWASRIRPGLRFAKC